MADKYRTWFLVFVLLLTAVFSALPMVDRQAEERYSGMFQRALVTFALARTLNGVISTVQGTELALQPAGVGVTLTPGEILDPVNDLVERFSWVMLAATVSLGIQQVMLDISDWWPVRLAVIGLGILGAAVLLAKRSPAAPTSQVLFRVWLVVLFVRFAVPLTLIANDMLYQVILEARYQSSTEVISASGMALEEIAAQDTEAPREADSGNWLFGTVGRAMDQAAEALDLRARVNRIREQAGAMIEHLIQLIVVFLLQSAVFPILFLWIMLRMTRWVFSSAFFKPVAVTANSP